MSQWRIRQAERVRAWTLATGLRVSTARCRRPFPWLSEYKLPDGFDHTMVFYDSATKNHIVLTEPYESVDEALRSMFFYGRPFCFVVGAHGQGLWNPPHTRALLLAREGQGQTARINAMVSVLPFVMEE